MSSFFSVQLWDLCTRCSRSALGPYPLRRRREIYLCSTMSSISYSKTRGRTVSDSSTAGSGSVFLKTGHLIRYSQAQAFALAHVSFPGALREPRIVCRHYVTSRGIPRITILRVYIPVLVVSPFSTCFFQRSVRFRCSSSNASYQSRVLHGRRPWCRHFHRKNIDNQPCLAPQHEKGWHFVHCRTKCHVAC